METDTKKQRQHFYRDYASGQGSTPPVPTPTTCPDRVTYATVGAGSDLDLGLTGNHHEARFSDGGSLTLALTCGDPGSEGCVDCTVDGPAASATAVDDGDCPTRTCEYFFGPPIPQSIPGAFVCLVYRVEAAAGVVSPVTGASAVDLDALWSFFVPLAIEQPCPVCSGAAVGTLGTCAGGDRDGMPCTRDVRAHSPVCDTLSRPVPVTVRRAEPAAAPAST